VAIGTIGAVAYALFRDLVLENRRRPKLELRFDAAGSDRVVAARTADTDAAHVRLRMSNEPGKDTADDVVVIVTEVRRLEPRGEVETTLIGLPLAWWGTSTQQAVATVHPGAERHLNLLHVDMPVGDVELDVLPQPPGGQHLLGPGRFEVDLEVRARNADASRYTVRVEWEGAGAGEPWDRLRVEPPRRRT
jgi:hypothetical protein